MKIKLPSSGNWTLYKLSEIITLIGGGTPKTTNPDYWNGNIPWLSVKDFNNDFCYVYTTEKTITQLGLEQSSTKLLEKYDIIISARGTVGEIAMIPFPMAFNQSCYGIRAKPNLVDSIFLYYLLKFNIRILKNNVHGSVFDTITRDTFDALDVNLPPLPLQKKIASTLSSLDDKIEINTRMNKVLEEIARALFHRWFVEFEFPDAEDRPYISSGGKMVESEMGSVPEGWEVGTIGDVITLFDSKRIPLSSNERVNMAKIYPYYGAASLMDYVDDYIFDGTYLLLGEDGTVIDSKGYPILQYVWGKFWVNNHAHIIKGTNGFTVESLYILFKQTSVQSIVTGAVQPKINQGNLRNLALVIPPVEILQMYNDIISPLFAEIRNNLDENKILANSRDTLLPKLMNRELPVPISSINNTETEGII